MTQAQAESSFELENVNEKGAKNQEKFDLTEGAKKKKRLRVQSGLKFECSVLFKAKGQDNSRHKSYNLMQ